MLRVLSGLKVSFCCNAANIQQVGLYDTAALLWCEVDGKVKGFLRERMGRREIPSGMLRFMKRPLKYIHIFKAKKKRHENARDVTKEV